MKEILHNFDRDKTKVECKDDCITVDHCHPQIIDFSEIPAASACASHIRQCQEEQSQSKNFENAKLLATVAGRAEGVIGQLLADHEIPQNNQNNHHHKRKTTCTIS